jgi:hypothetical protein
MQKNTIDRKLNVATHEDADITPEEYLDNAEAGIVLDVEVSDDVDELNGREVDPFLSLSCR